MHRSARSRRLSALLETLENRQHFSVTTMQWQGQDVRANEGQWVVKLDGLKGNPSDQVRNANAALNGSGINALKHLGSDGLFLVHAPKNQQLGTVQKTLKQVNGFSLVEPDLIFSASATTSDPSFGNLWGLHNTGQTGGTNDVDIDAPEAWDVYNGSSGTPVVTAVIDSGVDYNHPDLAGNMWKNPGEVNGLPGVDDDGDGYVDDIYGYDFVNNDSDPFDDNHHGTHVAGTISASADNGIGVAGVNYNGRIMALKFLDASGNGSLSAAISAINYATKMKAQYGVNVRVLNNSWGGGGYTQSLYDAIKASGNAGQIFIAAAGNGGADQVGDNNDTVANYPSNYDLPNVVAVAATDKYDRLGSFSNYGATTVDLAAPGVDVLSTFPNGQYAYLSGTSMATPHVAGAASLAFSYAPNASVADVKSALMSGGDSVSALATKTVSGKRLNLLGTLQNLPKAPSAPTSLAAAASGTSITLSWSDQSSNEQSFVVERSTGGGAFAQVGTVGANVTSFTDSGLAASTTYTYQVKAVNAVGSSGYSNTASATTDAAVTVNPTPIPTPTPTPTPVTGDGLAATYFDNKDFTGKSLSRTDAGVNFNWSTGAPVSGFGSDTFSVRWSGYVVPTQTQTYTFSALVDDGARLWVNNKLLVDKLTAKAGEYSGSIALTAGQAYTIKMEYVENTGKAQAKLSWSTPTLAKQVIPQSQLYTTAPTTSVAVANVEPGTVFSSTSIHSVAGDLLNDDAAVA